MASDFVLRQTSVDLQNDLDKIERMLEVRSLGEGLRLDVNIRQLSALVSTADSSEAPFEISDDGGYTIFRIDDDGEILTKAFDSRDINQLVRIYHLGAGLSFDNNTLSVDSTITGIKKIYSIGQGLTLDGNGQLFIKDEIFNLARIYSVGDGLVLNGQGALSANVKVQESSDGAFELADNAGNVALRIKSNGHLETKEFDSEEVARGLSIMSVGSGLVYTQATGALSALVSTQTTSSGAYEIADEQGHVTLRITNEGHLVTKEFDSSTLISISSLGNGLIYNDGVLSTETYLTSTSEGAFEISDTAHNVALRLTSTGHLVTAAFNSEEVSRLVRIYSLGTGLILSASGELSATGGGGGGGTLTDVQVDGISVVTGTIARIAMPVQLNEAEGAFEISDEQGNIALRLTAEGHLKTKLFDSENINILPETIKDRYLHTNEATGELEWSVLSNEFQVVGLLPTPTATSPKVIYSLFDCRLYILDAGGASSNSVGVGLVGYMLVG